MMGRGLNSGRRTTKLTTSVIVMSATVGGTWRTRVPRGTVVP